MEKKNYKNNVIKLFAISFFNSIIFAYVVERIFNLERGLSVLQIQYITIIYALISFVLEVPCGVLADKWKKKYVLALGLFFSVFEFFICIYAYKFGTFVMAFSLAAIGGSLKSGTIDSIMYQSLFKLGRDSSYEKYMGMIKFTRYITNGLVGILGGFIAHRYGLTTNYWLSLIGAPISIALCLTLYEPKVKTKSTVKFQLFNHISKSLKIIKENPGVGQVIFYSGITGAVLFGQLHEMPSITYPSLGIPIYLFGFISFSITLAGGLAGIFSGRLIKRYSYNTLFNTILIISLIAIYLFSISTNWFGLVYLILAIFALEIISPMASGYIHKRVKDEYRATISSMQAFILQGLTIFVGLLFGFVANKFNIFLAFTSMSMLFFIYGIYFFIAWSPKKKLQKKLKSA